MRRNELQKTKRYKRSLREDVPTFQVILLHLVQVTKKHAFARMGVSTTAIACVFVRVG